MSRYRVMVWEPGGKPRSLPTSFVRIVDREIVHVNTRQQARERAAELRARRPERRVWVERACRSRLGLRLDLWRMGHRWVFPWRPR